jgi:DNA polymerase (family X)
MNNRKVAELLYKIADLLDIRGDIFFKTRAYRMAAQRIQVLDEDIEVLVKENRLQSIPGIGEALAKKIREYVETGSLEYYEKLKKEIPLGLLKLLEIPGLGPKKVSVLYNKMGIESIDRLGEACENGELRDLDGFGEVTEKNILRGIKLQSKTMGRVLINKAYLNGNKYFDFLKDFDKIKKISLAGSLRRMRETIGDVDILVSSEYPDEVMDYFVQFEDVKRVLLKGSTKTSVLLNDDLQVDLRVVEPKSFGAALQYFTGSKEHNVTMRSLAIKKGYKLNEYGLFDKGTEEYIIGENEKEIYEKLGLNFIPPELRENNGEFKASKEDSLPKLVEYDQIKGDLHVHSNYSDGSETIEDVVKEAISLGYEYVGIADHSESLKVANGVSERRLKKKIDEIKKLNKKFSDIRILCGTECEINNDGSIDYSKKILESLDYVGIGVHRRFKMTEKEATDRLVNAMSNDFVDFIVHPTCRLIGRREPLKLDFEKIFKSAVDNDVMFEINAFPDRLDLNSFLARQAKEYGVKFVIGTDAHTLNHMSFMRFGIAQARRGWLEQKDIINTFSYKDLKKLLKRR